jgi:branched-chain amino acid transport system ATP-binding protein
MLSLENIDVFYHELQALWGVSLVVEEGEIVALIGPNGAGKTTILRNISGLLRPASGDIRFMGRSLCKEPPHKIVELGISQVPESGKIFTGMSVFENLELGAFVNKARKERKNSLEWVFGIFPRLAERQNQLAGTLSGGERQMLAIGRALMSRPILWPGAYPGGLHVRDDCPDQPGRRDHPAGGTKCSGSAGTGSQGLSA